MGLCAQRVYYGSRIIKWKGVSLKFKLITSSGFDEYSKDLLGELLGTDNKPAKFADKIKSKEVKRTWFHTIEIDSFEELLEFKQACGCNLVIEEVGNIPTLEIYDSYRE